MLKDNQEIQFKSPKKLGKIEDIKDEENNQTY